MLRVLVLALTFVGLALPPGARQTASFDPALFDVLRWRHIGPFHGGPATAAAGVPSRPGRFYMGAAHGGLWVSSDYGRTWRPIFDDQPTGSIGAIAIAGSEPDVIYVGTGDGMSRSTDAGGTWTPLGLRDARQITRVVVDPRDAERVFVAALGRAYGPGEARGMYRSTDGGRHFDRVLYRDENTGAADVVLDPSNPDVLYAALEASRRAPWDDSRWTGPGTALMKSTDGGASWHPAMTGLPTWEDDGLGRIGIAIAPSESSRLFAVVEAGARSGLYRSDDAGGTWRLVNDDPRLAAGPAAAGDVHVHPTDPEVVFVLADAAWKSTDGGATFTAWREARGGGYRQLWIDPDRPDAMILAGDQGAIVTVNGGHTWSSAYNQATSRAPQVSPDAAFPYRVCGGRQVDGAGCVASRGASGQITMRDWAPAGRGGPGSIAPDPADPEIVYSAVSGRVDGPRDSGRDGGSVRRFDRRAGQVRDVGPPAGPDFRVARAAPLRFSPTDRRTLYFGANALWRTTDGGREWTAISPDLARSSWGVPASVGTYRDRPSARPARRGAISAIAPSFVDRDLIWAGTDDGLIHLTRDGGATWTDVTPPDLAPWAMVSLEASHFDRETAYAAVNALPIDDRRPHLYRTRDGGAHWERIVSGLPESGVAHAIREDPLRRGLLFAGTALAVYLSFDDGESWTSLRRNMPATPVRDLAIKEHDLVVGTDGRGFWILDDISALRQVTRDVVRAPAYVFRPGVAWRVRDLATHAPVPPDEPAAANPPDGAAIAYLLGPEMTGPVALEIVDPESGELIRTYSSADGPAGPSGAPGLHRVVWDLRYAPPPGGGAGVMVLPGVYRVRLLAGDRVYQQAVTVRLDPRVTVSMEHLRAQLELSKSLDRTLRRLAAARAAAPEGDAARVAALAEAAARVARLLESLQQADARPTPAQEAAAGAALAAAATLIR